MAQELGEVRDVVRILLTNTQIAHQSGFDWRGSPDYVRHYRFWGFNIRSYEFPTPIPPTIGMMTITVYHSHDTVVWHEVEFIDNTEHMDFSKTYRKQRGYYALVIVNINGTAIVVDVSTRRGN